LSEKMNSENMTVLAYSKDLGKVTNNMTTGYIMLGYDDIFSVRYFDEDLKGYWTKDGTVDIFIVFDDAVDEYSSIMKRCDEFNHNLFSDAERVGGRKYA